MHKRGLALAVAVVLILALALPALAQVNAPNAVQAGGVPTLPGQTFVGRINAVTQSDLPRFELVGSVVPPNKPGLYYTPPLGTQRYVLLVSSDSILKPIADAVKIGKDKTTPLVRVTGTPAYIPSTRGTAKAIVVTKVEILK